MSGKEESLMARSKRDIQSKSLSQIALKRLKKNKLSMFGLFVIFCAAMIDILGPMIRPDGTPMANDQVLEITTQKTGFTVDLLKIKKKQKHEKKYWFVDLVAGLRFR